MIEFSWELEDRVHIFNSYKELVEELRDGGVDPENELSDEFLINESYQLGEWNEISMKMVEKVLDEQIKPIQKRK